MSISLEAISNTNAPSLYIDGEIPEVDRSEIWIISEGDGARLWVEFMHSDPDRIVMRQMPKTHWVRIHSDNWMGWHDSANYPDNPDEVVPAIQKVTGWAEGDTILYMVSKKCMFMTKWGVFLRHWRHFLRMNNQPVLIRPGTGIFLCFGSSGDIGWGYRPVHPLEYHIEWIPNQSASTDIANCDNSR